MGFWQGKRVMVTGGSGFLGRHSVEMLSEKDCEVLVPRSKEYNLVSFDQAQQCMETFRPGLLLAPKIGKPGVPQVPPPAS